MTKADLQAVIASLKLQAERGISDCRCGECSAIPCWMSPRNETTAPIDEEQVISLTAMIAYVAHRTGKNAFRVEREFTDQFCIPNIKCLPAEHYDAAIRMMADQVPASL